LQTQFIEPKPIIIALDYHSLSEAVTMASQLDSSRCRLKVGKELFTATGPAVIEALHKLNFDVFLDLKFHDIPHTVANAVSVAAELGVWMVNVHASGGRRMMEAAVNAVLKSSYQPLLIAVTILTSMAPEDLHETGISSSLEEQVIHLAELAKDSGMNGVVCSAQEARNLKDRMGQFFKLVTPGIRLAENDAGDQRRTMTPLQALNEGSDYLVIGRPVTQSEDPMKSLELIYSQIDSH